MYTGYSLYGKRLFLTTVSGYEELTNNIFSADDLFYEIPESTIVKTAKASTSIPMDSYCRFGDLRKHDVARQNHSLLETKEISHTSGRKTRRR